jgi:hypothetical protein
MALNLGGDRRWAARPVDVGFDAGFDLVGEQELRGGRGGPSDLRVALLAPEAEKRGPAMGP